MLFRFICPRYAKGKLISPSSWNISFSSLPRRWTKRSKPSLRKPCAPYFVTAGLGGIFESCKTTLRAASSFPITASSNQRHSRAASRWRQSKRLQIRRLKKRCEEKFSQPASAPIGSSEVREEQRPDLA